MGICPGCHKKIDHLDYAIPVKETGEAVLWKTNEGTTELFHSPQGHEDTEDGFTYSCPECHLEMDEDDAHG